MKQTGNLSVFLVSGDDYEIHTEAHRIQRIDEKKEILTDEYERKFVRRADFGSVV